MSTEHLIGSFAAPIEITPDQQNSTRGVIVDTARENYALFNKGYDLICLYTINFSLDRNGKSILYKNGDKVYAVDYADIDEEFEDIFHTERDEDNFEPIVKRGWVMLESDPDNLPHNVKSRNGERVGIELVRYMLKSKEGQQESINIVRYFSETDLTLPLAEIWLAERKRNTDTGQEPKQIAA